MREDRYRRAAQARRNAGRKPHDSVERGSGAHKKLHASSKLIFSRWRWIANRPLANRFGISSRAGRCAILSLQVFRCCSQLSSVFRSASSPVAAAPVGAGYSWLRQRCANDPFARFARVTCSASVFRDQRPHRDCRPFSLRIAADCAQHRERLAGYSTIIARIGHCAGTQPDDAALANLFADGVTLDFGGNQNQRSDQRRNGDAGCVDWSGRSRRADLERTEFERSRQQFCRAPFRRRCSHCLCNGASICSIAF